MKLTRGHHKALPYEGMPEFMVALRSHRSIAGAALQLTILTACRTGEVLGARWSEFDLDNAVWTIPADRMKAGKEHRVPLSAPAVALLRALNEGRKCDYVFPGPTLRKPLSSMAMAMQLRRMKVDVTVHGFRSSFRDWAAETTPFSHEVCEQALAHAISSKTEAAYRRGDQLDKRRKLMEAWANYCESKAADNVVAIRRQAPFAS